MDIYQINLLSTGWELPCLWAASKRSLIPYFKKLPFLSVVERSSLAFGKGSLGSQNVFVVLKTAEYST